MSQLREKFRKKVVCSGDNFFEMSYLMSMRNILVLFFVISEIGRSHPGVHGCNRKVHYVRVRHTTIRYTRQRYEPPPPPPRRRPPPPPPPPTEPTTTTTTTPPPPPQPFYSEFKTELFNEKGLCGPLVKRRERRCHLEGRIFTRPDMCTDAHLGYNYEVEVIWKKEGSKENRTPCEHPKFQEKVSHFNIHKECDVPSGFLRKEVVQDGFIMLPPDKIIHSYEPYVCTCKDGFRTKRNLKGCEHAPECHLPDNDCVDKKTKRKKIGVKSCEEAAGSQKYTCQCLPGFELNNKTKRECKFPTKCRENVCGKDPNAYCSILPTGAEKCSCKSTVTSKRRYLPKEKRCCDVFFASTLRAWDLAELTGERIKSARTGFTPLTDFDFAVGHHYCNTFYVTSTGVLACFRQERRRHTDELLKCYNYFYAHHCLGKPQPSNFEKMKHYCSYIDYHSVSSSCSVPSVFRTAFKLNLKKKPELEEPQLKSTGDPQRIEAIFSPLAMNFAMLRQSSITIRKVYRNKEAIMGLRKHGIRIMHHQERNFKEIFVVHFKNMHVIGNRSLTQDTVTFYIILATSYTKTYLMGFYDDCTTFNSDARSFLWTRPSPDYLAGLEFDFETGAKNNFINTKTVFQNRVALSSAFGYMNRGIFFNPGHSITPPKHFGLECQDWLNDNDCTNLDCAVEWETRSWCPQTPNSIAFFYEDVHISNLKTDVKCYQLRTARNDLGEFMPTCCYNEYNGFLNGREGRAWISHQTPVNVVTRGKLTDRHWLFEAQTKAYSACCGNYYSSRFETPQCEEMKRRRPFTVNELEIDVYTVSIWRGDVQVNTLDGASFVFNGALEVLMAKGMSTKTGIGFSITALLQPGFSATKVTFATDLAMQCGNNTKQSTSDLLQFSLNANRTKIQVLVNGLLKPNLTVGVIRTVQLFGATLKTFTDHMILTLHCGLAVRVTCVSESLSQEIMLAPGYSGLVMGLLGNNDKDPSNDIQSRDGTKVLPLSASEEEIFPVASTWRVDCSDPSEALLFTGKPCGAFNDLAFRPAFFNLNRSRAAHPEGEALCGDNMACWVDLAGTNSSTLAEQAKKDDEEVKEQRQKENNRPPVFKPRVLICNLTMESSGSCSIAVSDPDSNDTVTLTVTGVPNWMRFDSAQHRLSWAATPKDVASQGLQLTATATDRLGGITVQPIVLHLCACQNGGTCEHPSNLQSGEINAVFLDIPCRCSKGWAGSHCEKDEDGCLGNPCVTSCTDVTVADHAAEADNVTVPLFRCAPCPAGFEGDGQACNDIDECLSADVQFPQECMNYIGTYDIACVKGFRMVNGECLDFDECVAGNASCPRNALCKNTPGSYGCECPSGTSLMGSTCVDPDECSDGQQRCADRANTECRNTFNGFECVCKFGFDNNGSGCVAVDYCNPRPLCDQICNPHVGGFKCSCGDGFELAEDGSTCVPVQNCSQEQRSSCVGGQCAIGEAAVVICSCGFGRVLETIENTTYCRDKNECSNSSLNTCVGVAICQDKPNGFDCVCPEGYKLSANKTSCLEIDECAQDLGPCDARTGSCRNTPGSFECVCKEGFSKANNETCVDHDECSEDTSPCSDPGAVCKNLVGSFECPCGAGFNNNGSHCINQGEIFNPNGFIDGSHSCRLCANLAHCIVLVFIALFRYHELS